MTKKTRSKKAGSGPTAASTTTATTTITSPNANTNAKLMVAAAINASTNGNSKNGKDADSDSNNTSPKTNANFKVNLNSNSSSKTKIKTKTEELIPPEIPAITLPPVTVDVVNVNKKEQEQGTGQRSIISRQEQDEDQRSPLSPTSSTSTSTSSSTSSPTTVQKQDVQEPSIHLHTSTSMTNTNKEELRNKLFKSHLKVSLRIDKNKLLHKDKERQNEEINDPGIHSKVKSHANTNANSNNANDTNSISITKFDPPDPPGTQEETMRLLDNSKNHNSRNYQSFITTENQSLKNPGESISGTGTTKINGIDTGIEKSNLKAKTNVNSASNSTQPTDVAFNFDLFEKSLEDEIQSRENPTPLLSSQSPLDRDPNRDREMITIKSTIKPIPVKVPLSNQNQTLNSNNVKTKITSKQPSIEIANRPKLSTATGKDFCIDMSSLDLDDYGPEPEPSSKSNSNPADLVPPTSKSMSISDSESDPESDRKKVLSALSTLSRSPSVSTHTIINTVKSLVAASASASNSGIFSDKKRYATKLDLEDIKKAACAYAIANNPNSKIRTRAINPAVSLSQTQVQSPSKSNSNSILKAEHVPVPVPEVNIKDKSKSKSNKNKNSGKIKANVNANASGLLSDSEVVEEILGLDLEHENQSSFLNINLSNLSLSNSNNTNINNSNLTVNHSRDGNSKNNNSQSQSFQLYSVPEDLHFLSTASSQVNLGQTSNGKTVSRIASGVGGESLSGDKNIMGCLSSSSSSVPVTFISTFTTTPSMSVSKSKSKSVSTLMSMSTSSGSPSSGSGSGPGGLAACCSILDGINNLCEVKTCSQPASKKCANCKSVYYCGENHQKDDWKKHKNQCIPYKMEVKGSDDVSSVSVMVAVRNIPAGKLIFAEKPFLLFPVASFDTDFVHVMDLNCVMSEDFLHTCGAKTPACLGCMKCVEFIGAQRHECSKCGLPLCSPQCEYEMSHQIGECQVIANCGDLKNEEKPPNCFHSLYLDVEILRALQLEALYPSEWEKFLELRNHVRVELYKKSERYGKFVGNMKRLVPYSAKVSGYNFDLIRDVHAIITALSFKPSLKSPYKMLIGTQLYFDHSCVPNTIHYVEHQVTGHVNKMRCVVKAAMPIMKGDVISVDFVPTPYLAYLLRRRVLENLCLNCCCRRCVQPSVIGDHSGDITCPNCRRGLVSPERPLEWKESIWSCRACQEEVPYSQVTHICQDWRNQLYIIPKTRDGLDKLYNFIQKAQRHLNPTHELVVMAWCYIETIIRPNLEANRSPDAYKVLPHVAIQDYQLLRQYCEISEKHFQALRPGLWLDRGVVLFQKFYATFALTSKEYQENRLQRKPFVNEILRSMKCLQDSLAILQTYEGYNATDSVNRLTQDAIWTLATVKTFIAKFMQDNAASLANKSRSVDI